MRATCQFLDALGKAGIPCPESHVLFGKIVRYRTAGDSNRNSWYIAFGDDDQLSGAFGCWKRGIQRKFDSSYGEFEAQPKREMKRGRQLKERRDRELSTLHEATAIRSEQRWNRAKPARAYHQYFAKRRVPPLDLRESKGVLLIPVSDGTKIKSLQMILPSGEKRFAKGGAIRGNYYLYGEPTDVIYLVEGFATGATIHQATGKPFVVAFSASNLEPVARNLQSRFPDVKIVICADDDWMTVGNPGLSGATSASRATKATVCTPEFETERDPNQTDFNDLYVASGLDAVRKCLGQEQVPGLKPTNTLLSTMVEFLRKYVVFPSNEALFATALWVMHTWVIQLAETSPILAVTSAERECGKTRLFELLELLVARPWRVVSPTEAVLFRKIERDMPSILLDETDTIFGRRPAPSAEAVRAVLNAGNRIGAMVSRAEAAGDRFEVKDFSVFCPKAVAGIGDLPDTITSRSIPIRLRRRNRSETVAPFFLKHAKLEADQLRKDLEIWAHYFTPPEIELSNFATELSDRARESWLIMGQIALHAGEEAFSTMCAAAAALHEARDDDETIGRRLLVAIHSAFNHSQSEMLTTKELISHLVAVEDSEWNDMGKAGITPAVLAKLLRPYGIRSIQNRVGQENLRGYRRNQFVDAWQRYCPELSTQAATDATTLQTFGSDLLDSGLETTSVASVASVAALSEGTPTVFEDEVRI